jgi:hypothetical protein
MGYTIALAYQFLAEIGIGAMQTVLGNIVLEAEAVLSQRTV